MKKELEDLIEAIKSGRFIEYIKEKFYRLIDDKEELLKRSFKFRGFASSFVDHIARGEIKITIRNAKNPEIVKESYTYATGKGGKNIDEILPPWQVKKELKGVHSYINIDKKILRIKKVKETKKLVTGENVEIVEIEFFVKELNKWSKKSNSSTLWPKEWSLNKIQQVTKEASENIFEKSGNKYRGTSKEGFEVEFFSIDGKIIENSYPYTKNL